MNAPWYHPAEIDWQDGLNPLAIPAFREQTNPYFYRALQRPTMVAIRQSRGAVPRLYVAPDEAYTSLAPYATIDTVITAKPGSWLIGISAASAQPEGFKTQITMPWGTRLFNQPTGLGCVCGPTPFYFSEPQGIPDGGPIYVRMINQSGVANSSQVALWMVEPE